MKFAHTIFIEDPTPASWAQYILLLRHYRELDPAPWKRKEKWRANIINAIVDKENTLTCAYCGLDELIPHIGDKGRHPRMATLDHLIPRHRGGSDNHDNLVISCPDCNSRKSNNMPTERELTCRRVSEILGT
jgi:5-methylcytosine-specific restriction endonuclease McrA